MARNEEKTNAMLNKWLSMKQEHTQGGPEQYVIMMMMVLRKYICFSYLSFSLLLLSPVPLQTASFLGLGMQ